MAETLLEMRAITKQFPGVVANDRISFDLLPGEIHALVGENGAGKTTLMKILYGLHRPDAGSILVRGAPLAIRGPRDAIRHGIGMVHQHFMLVQVFTVLENIILGDETAVAGVLRLAEPRRRITAIMEQNRLEVPLDARIEELSVGMQQRVEILKILYRGASILVFDEPTAVLTPQETTELFRTFKAMRDQGKGIVFISHKLDEVLEIANRITVIRQGRVVQTMERAGATKAGIAELMVGKPVLLEVERPAMAPARWCCRSAACACAAARVRSPSTASISRSTRARSTGSPAWKATDNPSWCAPWPAGPPSKPGTSCSTARARSNGACASGASGA